MEEGAMRGCGEEEYTCFETKEMRSTYWPLRGLKSIEKWVFI
jgi:hypothetical protein